MKRKIAVIFIFFIVYCSSLAQSKKYDSPKKTNTIVLTKEGDANAILIDFAKYLQDSGYSIERIDKDLLSISTDFRTYKFDGIAVMKINAFVKQNDDKVKIEIKGKIEITNPYGGQIPYEACNCGFAGDARKKAFKEMISLIENYKFDNLEFLVK